MARHFTLKKLKNGLLHNRSLKIALTVLFLVLLLLSGLSLLQYYLSSRQISNPPGTIGNTAGNLNNLGLFCEYNGTVYFSNSYDHGALYAMTPAEDDIHFISNSMVQTLLAGGDYLYYFQTGVSGSGDLSNVASTHGFNRADLKGKHARPLTDDVVITGQLVNDFLYLLTVGKEGIQFYKMKPDRSGRVNLAEYAINPACAVDGTIFYNGTIDNHYLYTLDTETDVPHQILNLPLWYPIIQDQYLYFMDLQGNYRLSRYNFETEECVILTEDRVDCFNVGNDYIYYQKNGSTPQLKCMRTDGSDVKVIAEGNFTHINMTSEYVYFQSYENGTLYHSPIGSGSCSTFTEALNAIPAKK